MISDCFLQYRKIDAQIIKGDVFRWKEVLNNYELNIFFLNNSFFLFAEKCSVSGSTLIIQITEKYNFVSTTQQITQ